MIKKLQSVFVFTIALMFSVASGFAQNCTAVAGSPELVIAVASNFYEPAIAMVDDFIASEYPNSSKSIQVCHNSTGVLLAEINAGNAPYGIFFAADESAELLNSDYNSAFVYAKGIPALISQTVAPKNLISTAPSVSPYAISEINRKVTSSDALRITGTTPNATQVAIANTVNAPYGAMGCKILQDMGLVGTSATACGDLNTSPLGWMNTPYNNIATTYNKVFGQLDQTNSGFVSLAQVCSTVPNQPNQRTSTVIKFTANRYTLNQMAILLDSPDSATPTTLAGELRNFILNGIGVNSPYWNTFLGQHCYGTLP